MPKIAPKRPPADAPGKNNFKYREQFGVIVVCKDEDHQKAVYEQLRSQAHKCKVVRA